MTKNRKAGMNQALKGNLGPGPGPSNKFMLEKWWQRIGNKRNWLAIWTLSFRQWGATKYSKWGELLIRVSFLKVSLQILTVAWSGNYNHSLLFEWGNCSSGSNLPKITQKKSSTLGPLYPKDNEPLSADSLAQHSGLVAEKEGLDYKIWKENSNPQMYLWWESDKGWKAQIRI